MTDYNSFSQIKGLTWMPSYENIIEWEEGKTNDLVPPIGATIDLTTGCNLKCAGCNAYRSWKLGKTLETDEAFKIIDMFRKWRNETNVKGTLKTICFAGGGEPTLHTNFDKIIQYAHEAGFQVGISTNGLQLNNRNIRKALIEHAEFCGISMDSGTKTGWSKYKGVDEGNYDLLIRGIKSLIKEWKEFNRSPRKCDLVYKFLITPGNQYEILDGCRLAKSLGFNSFYARPAAIEGLEIFKDKELNFDVVKIKEQLSECEKEVSDSFKVFASFGRVNNELKKTHKFKQCHATPLLVQVCADGYWYLCIDSRYLEWSRMCKWDEVRMKWGSKWHKSMIKTISLDKCVRCAFGNYNEQIEKTCINDELYRYFP